MKTPVWVLRETVLTLHEQSLAEFGGEAGIRDESLLDSALAKPEHLFAYGKPGIFDLAASYGFGLVKNHPFVDGNKRTALATCLVFLSENGLLPNERLEADAWEALMRDVAAGRLDRQQTTTRLRRLLRSRK